MSKKTSDEGENPGREAPKSRRLRADAQRSEDALLAAALAVFASSGVDAPVRDIATKAGVGIATLYRRFPKRSDLIVAVFRQQIDACADAADTFVTEHPPGEALSRWMLRYAEFIATKRGLAAALHTGDSAYDALPLYFDERLRPALRTLLDAAAAAGTVRTDVDPNDLLQAIASLCMAARDDRSDYVQRMVTLLMDGLRYPTVQPT